MPYLTLGEAAKSAGRTKPTILNAIKKGRISAKKNDAGSWQIDPAELHRVYPAVSPNGLTENKILHGETPSNTNDNRVLQVEVEKLKEQLAREKELNEDLMKDRDEWRRQATALLTDQREKPAQKPAGGFFDRLGYVLTGKA